MFCQTSTNYIEKLEKIYHEKVRQAALVQGSNQLLYMIYQAEADAIDHELKHHALQRV